MPIATKKAPAPPPQETKPPPRAPRFLAGVQQAVAAPARFPSRIEAARPRTRPSLVDEAAANAEAEGALARAAQAEQVANLAMERTASAIQALRLQADRLAEQARGDVMEIAFAIARRIVDAELHTNPEAYFSLVRSALRHAGESRRVVVRACPEDAERLRMNPHVTDGLTLAKIEVVDDETLQRGDVLVDADFGRIDGRLSSRFAEVKRAVEGEPL